MDEQSKNSDKSQNEVAVGTNPFGSNPRNHSNIGNVILECVNSMPNGIKTPAIDFKTERVFPYVAEIILQTVLSFASRLEY
jgi:hypothetical protein